MNLSKILKYSLLFGALSLSACVRESLEAEGDMKIVFGAKVQSPLVETKASTKTVANPIDFDTDVALDINLVRWDENGSTALYGKEELPATMNAPSTASGSWEREISVNPPQFYVNRTASVGFFGWYPDASHEGWVKTGNNVIAKDDAGTYMKFAIDGATDVMVSDFVKGDYNSGVPNIPFKHALCMYNIYAYAVDEQTRREWGLVNTITIRNLPEEVIIRFPDDDITLASQAEISYSVDSQPYNIYEDAAGMELYAGLPTSRDEAYVGTILGGAPNEGVLGLTAYTEKEVSGNSVSIARNFKPGYTYNIFLRFSSKGIINAEITASNWIYESDKDYYLEQEYEVLTDLSRYGTANSYIVSSANRGYCFTGNVKGNGVNVLEDRNGNVIQLPDASVSLNVDHVAIVRSDAMMKKTANGWEAITDRTERAQTQLIELLSTTLTDNRVIFRVPGIQTESGEPDYSLQYKGNAKIAAFNAAGDIIWSWHIWVTDTPTNEGYSNGYVVMDRNLGAVTTDYNTFQQNMSAWSGLYYQFGRKDPMFRDPIQTGQQWESWPDVDNQEHPAIVKESVAVAEAHRHPMTYYYSENSGEWSSSPNQAHYWGYISVREDIVKTLYDPCPPGYRVPGSHLWENPPIGMTHSKLGSGDSFSGYIFNFSLLDVYYPKTNCIAMGEVADNDQKGTTGSYDFVYMNTATPYEAADGTSDPGHAYHFRYNHEIIGTNYSQFLVGDPDDGYHTERSAAYPVRCVFENSSPVITDLSEAQTANSYIIEESGFYEFDATVRGNGVVRLNVVDTDMTDAPEIVFDGGLGGANITNVDHVDVLWWQGDLTAGSTWRDFVGSYPENTAGAVEEYCLENCPVVVMDNGKLVDGKPLLYIRINENTHGNVGIAAYDLNGQILWTWHLWLVPDIKHIKFGDFTLMDRNLGATYAPTDDSGYADLGHLIPAFGLYYQWGRKDPFFPTWKTSVSANETMAWCEKTSAGWVLHRSNKTASMGSIPESVANPLAFFTSTESRWQNTYNTGTSGPMRNLWGYVGSSSKGNSFAKTVWDPCPPGYRVMQHDVFSSANVATIDRNNSCSFTNLGSNIYGMYIGSDTYMSGGGVNANAISDGIWFPNAGMIDRSGVFNMTANGPHKLWTASAMSGYTARNMNWTKTNAGTTYTIKQEYKSSASAREDENSYMSTGMVVRCQMD